jgi:glycerol-3-phosphate acyltransferase PlsX
MNILIDGMGGDNAPEEIVKGAVRAARRIDDTITIIGPEDRIKACLADEGWNGSNIRTVDATQVISNSEAPAMAVRKKKDSTISKGMRLVKEGEADVFISGGSTGALLSAGLFTLGRIRGIKRPAIAAFFPKIGMDGNTLLLDCGANVEAKPEYLQQFGIMGSIFVENVKGVKDPKVMLLNVGAEDEKGDDLHKEAFGLLKDSGINFAGNIEGRDVCTCDCDVVVADGFSGNVFLKSSEGLALAVIKLIKNVLTSGTMPKLAALLLYNKLKETRKQFDYSEEGGAPILGLKGAVFKIHGSSKAKAVYNAVLKAKTYVEMDVTTKIEKAVAENANIDADSGKRDVFDGGTQESR